MKTTNLLNKPFFSMPIPDLPLKRQLKAAGKDIYDYIFAYFCRVHKPNSVFNVKRISLDLNYSEKTVRTAIRMMKKINILWIAEITSSDFFVFIKKQENVELFEKVEKDLNEKAPEIDSQNGKYISQNGKYISQNGKYISQNGKYISQDDSLEVLKKQDVSGTEKGLLDHNIDHIYIDHTYIDQKNDVNAFKNDFEYEEENEEFVDDDFEKFDDEPEEFFEEEKPKKNFVKKDGLSAFELPENLIQNLKPTTAKKESEQVNFAEKKKDSGAENENEAFVMLINAEYSGKKINFDQNMARQLVKNYSPVNIIAQVKALPLRKISSNPAGYLLKAIEKNYALPQENPPQKRDSFTERRELVNKLKPIAKEFCFNLSEVDIENSFYEYFAKKVKKLLATQEGSDEYQKTLNSIKRDFEKLKTMLPADDIQATFNKVYGYAITQRFFPGYQFQNLYGYLDKIA